MADFMRGEIQHGQEGVRIGFVAVYFHSASEQRLREDEVREFGQIEELRVDVEELAQERLQAVEVDCGLGVKPFKVDVYEVHVLVAVGILILPLALAFRRIGKVLRVFLRFPLCHCE